MANVGDTAAWTAEEGEIACFGIWPEAPGDCLEADKPLLPPDTGARGEGRAAGGLALKFAALMAEMDDAGGRDGPIIFSRTEYL